MVEKTGTVAAFLSLNDDSTNGDLMSVSHRLPAAAAVALALLASVPASAQEAQQQRRPQQQRHSQQQHPQQQHPPQQQRPQEAQRRRGGNGAGIAAGVIGGLAAGALLGGVLSGRGGPAGPGYDGEVEGGPGPGYGGGCPLVRQPVYDGAGRFAGYGAAPSC